MLVVAGRVVAFYTTLILLQTALQLHHCLLKLSQTIKED
jgi:hypothetical protein